MTRQAQFVGRDVEPISHSIAGALVKGDELPRYGLHCLCVNLLFHLYVCWNCLPSVTSNMLISSDSVLSVSGI